VTRRLPPRTGEWIDRNEKVSFHFEGERVVGFKGDVVSSALLASGHRTLARSFKYHRPRGVLSFANHDANVLLEHDARTHIRGDVELAENGRRYRAVNTWGGLKFDRWQLIRLLAPFLPVGFYYKAFYRPRFLFPLWERLIRRAAGLGRVDFNASTERQPRRHDYCDVLIIGAGAAGLAAAHALANSGLTVMVSDENPRFGGSLDYLHSNDDHAQAFKHEALQAIETSTTVKTLPGYFAAGYYADNSVALVGPDGVLYVHARTVIVATGAYEQPAVFRNNDAPGVMLASAAARLAYRYAVAPFENACVIAGNDDAYTTALELQHAGLSISAVIDIGDPATCASRAAAAIAAGIQVIPNAEISHADTRRGELAAIVIRCGTERAEQRIECDGVLMSVGWVPAAGLLYQAGGKIDYDDVLQQVVPTTLPDGVFAAGRVNGLHELSARVADGRAAASEASTYLGSTVARANRPSRAQHAHSHAYPISRHARGNEFVDFDEDIVVGDLETAWREGFDSVELMKRYSTIGMGPSQGKTSNMNGVRVLARLNDQAVGAIGVTTTRPFTHPIAMGKLAGRRIRRQWRTPMHTFHTDHHADVTEAGTWLRPMSYAAASPASAVHREYRQVREAVGVIDVSTLGKIELFGRDVIALLEYAYTCSFDKLAPHMSRYIFMVDSSGSLVDDGVAARFSDEHFYITATSSHAQTVVRQLQLFADQLALEVTIIDRTFQVGAINLAGPRSREVLERLTDIDVSDAAFPYLAVRGATVAGVSTRLLRVGFVGELGYEIHAPANSCIALWQALMEAGDEFGIAPFGVAAQRLLRLEKGHLIFGQDTDGMTNPFEVNLGWGVRLGKERFVGKHALEVLKPRDARKLIGFERVEESDEPLRECNLIIERGGLVGRVTSVEYSPHRGCVIGLASVSSELSTSDRVLQVLLSNGEYAPVKVVELPFYDPGNTRQQAEKPPAAQA
jgi:sarcosine oxidase, subunit alpha